MALLSCLARLLSVLLICLTAAGSLAAEARPDALGIVFSEIEKRIIRDYYGDPEHRRDADQGKNGKSKGAGGDPPPGLAKRATLPPGLARQVERNGTLPPGLARRNLPADLDLRLPRRRDDIRRVIVDRDVVLIEEATGLVLDVIEGVLQETAK